MTLSKQPNGRINCVLLIGDKHLVGCRLGDYNYVSGEKMNSLGLKIFCFIAFYSWAHHQNGSAFWSSDSNAKTKIRNFREMRIISFCQILGLISARSIENKFIRNDQTVKLLEFMVTKDLLSRTGLNRTQFLWTILNGFMINSFKYGKLRFVFLMSHRRWLFRSNSACGGIETVTIEKMHPSSLCKIHWLFQQHNFLNPSKWNKWKADAGIYVQSTVLERPIATFALFIRQQSWKNSTEFDLSTKYYHNGW